MNRLYSSDGDDFPSRQQVRSIGSRHGLTPEIRKNMNSAPDLALSMDYDALFGLVKNSVRNAIGKERVGLGLALADLPNVLGAFWEVGGNYIVLNENLVRAMKVSGKSDEEFNSFVFVILMHEYIHSLGYVDEAETREMTMRICTSIFQPGHPAFTLGNSDPWEVYPFLKFLPRSGDPNLKFVSKFDSDSTSYIA